MAGHHRQAGLGELAALKVATVQTVLGIPYELVDSHIVHNGEDVEGIQIVNEISDLKIVMLFRELNRGNTKPISSGGKKTLVCRDGVCSTTAAAILTDLGFEHVSNLKGGVLEWIR